MSNTIEVLGVVGGIRHRPHMYIGSTETPNQLVHEVLDNALDELVNKYATSVHVSIGDNDSVEIRDDGRGIPHYVTIDGKRHYAPVVICTELHSSGKTGKTTQKLYDIHIGRHGVGLTVVNALSKFLEIITTNRGYTLHVRFEDARLVKSDRRKAKPGEKGTIVRFRYLDEIFENPIDKNEIIERLQLIRFVTNKQIFYNGELVQPLDIKQLFKTHFKTSNPILETTVNHNHESIQLWFTWAESDKTLTPESLLAINLKFCEAKFSTTLINLIGEACEQLKIVDKHKAIYRLRLFASVILKEPVFDSQHKTKCITPLSKELQEKLLQQLKQIVKSDFVKESLELTALLEAHKRSRKKKQVRKTFNLDYFKACEEIPGQVLYIVEGKSAEGTLLDIRNPKNEAVFPLRGKLINVMEHGLKRVAESQIVVDLLKVIGYDFKSLKRNFEKYVIATDPDPDGCVVDDCEVIVPYKRKRMSEIDVGDQVLGFDINSQQFTFAEVKAVWERQEEVEYVYIETTDGEIALTLDHPVLTPSGYKEAGQLTTSDRIVCFVGGDKAFDLAVPITNITKHKKKALLRDLTTETGNFIANNLVIHNSHIAALLLMLFDKFCRQLIEEQRVVLLQTPLWGLVGKNKFIPLKERPKQVSNGYQLVRFKGLGEFEPFQFERFLRDKSFHYTVKPFDVDYEKLLRNKKILVSDLVKN